MGASGWTYFAPYQPDVAQALESLRQRVFADKDFGDPAIGMVMDNPDAVLAHLPPERRADLLAALEQVRADRAAQPEPATIEELLEQAGTEGTHSILDIACGLSDGPDFGTAFPMPDDVKLELYGSTQPTHEQVEAMAHERGEDLERWQCWYVVVYKDGKPNEIYFEGCSGD